ncbi:MAG: hypothetical protein VX202_09485 [Pseudomonadota bacterium]|jgi:hypothetical protein|nr:hypothetical protein [Rhodovulum sp. FJ3]MDV4168407.1 hypothetical protein [Rhodovulum sp. FJ3]MEC8629736.1 hypothetical protein [Pseudomonadota bacterium]MEC8796316.1 hypothetical protein [Pseudomonadota bacterium]MEE3317988.1 hypothetical protein [Pseudomonadota bacterium]|tara:strand:- start:14 stop:145 length:132 start_codon:yes stop_codon:yes gene_type:complete
MSKTVKAMVAICLVAFTAACAAEEEVVYVEPDPIVSEPVSTKY